MRLTVHLENAPKIDVEVKTKDGVKTIKKTMNTIVFNGVDPSQVKNRLNSIPKDKGTPTKHYLTREKITGMATARKKK